MISRIVKTTIERLKDPSRSFKERVFIMFTLVTVLFAVFALIFDIAFGEDIVEIITLIISIVLTPIVMLLSVRRNKVMIAVRVIVLGLIFLLLPILFFSGGGLRGGGILWIIFAYLYTGLVLSGVWKPVVLVVLTIETIIFYTVSYFHPERISEHSEEMYYIDSLVSIILVGVMCCLMVWFEEWLFSEENKRAKEETEKVEELNRSQNRFFSSMSHEIRTPINSILGLNEIILRQPDASDEIIKDAGNIQGAGKMLLSLINDILDMSKIEAGKMDIIPVNYNLGDMISEIVNMMWLKANQKGLELKIQIEPSTPAELFGDEVRIKQILVNLLNNAVKYTREGTVTLRIEKEELRGDEVLLLFSVIDTGIGIKQDAIPYLFDAFRRADEEKNAKIEGTGLGLSIVKQLVDLMDGKITVSSVYTEGSTFMVTLWQKVTRRDPIGELQLSNYGINRSHGKYEPGFKAPEARILIVDDNEMNLEVEKKLLDGTEITIDTVMSGDEALSLTATEHYDLILMDHLMPEMDGIECMQYIRKQQGGFNNHVPVIVLTANAGGENKELYSRSGFDGYLVKPVSGRQLEEMLIQHLPDNKIEMNEDADFSTVQMNTSKGYSKKIPILVATSSMCDLPKEVLDECQIDIIPFSIITEGRMYYDILEASTDEVMRYAKSGADFDSQPPTVLEFERFFGREIKKAHQLIYISITSGVSKEYENAMEAAKAYGNVYVFDSGFNSSAMGILVLMAHKLASQGRSFEKIIEELNAQKDRISCSFITGDAEFVMRRGGLTKGAFRFVSTFGFRPIIDIRKGLLFSARLCMGEYVDCYEKYIDFALPWNCKPDLDLIIIDYVDLSEYEKVSVEKHIKSKYDFENIIFQKASSVMSLNCGSGALGITYMSKGDPSYNLSQYFRTTLDPSEIYDIYGSDYEEDSLEEGNEEETPKDDVTIKYWYEEIPGIDAQTALTNSGSEESLLAILKIFYESIDPRSQEIEEFYNNEDWENYTIKVHALKSSARLVGAVDLGEDAYALEMAGKENNIDFIREHNEKLLKDYRSYKEVLAPYMKEESKEPDEEPEEEVVSADLDSVLLDSLYFTLKEAAENQNGKLIERTLLEIQDYSIPNEDCERLDMVKRCLENQAFDKIISLIEERS